MIIEIGAGLIAAGSAVGALTVMVQAGGKVHEARENLAGARKLTASWRERAIVAEERANRLKSIARRDEMIREMEIENNKIAAERNAAQRALKEVQPVRGERGRFVRRQPTATLLDTSGNSAAQRN